jgi:hypothetical protein
MVKAKEGAKGVARKTRKSQVKAGQTLGMSTCGGQLGLNTGEYRNVTYLTESRCAYSRHYHFCPSLISHHYHC